MPSLLLAIVAAVGLAWWSWRDRLNQPVARWAALARAVALAALLLLVLNPDISAHRSGVRTLVLLDHSISMHAAAGSWSDAAPVAASLGDTVAFGELTPGEPGGESDLLGPLSSAVAAGRPVTIVTDGELGDVASIPPDMLRQATVRVFPRQRGADIAVVGVDAPSRLAAGDTLAIDVELARTDDAPDTAAVVVRDSSRVVLRGIARFAGARRTHVRLAAVLPRGYHGQRWLTVERVGAPDAEPGDDARLRGLRVTPAPGVVVLAELADWDARALYRTLRDVVAVPVRGYVQLQRGQWQRMDDLQRVATAEVTAAARTADLLAVRGDVATWRNMGTARLLWPRATLPGDWYVAAGPLSPISGAFAGVDPDSLPPAAAVRALDTLPAPGWTGAAARRARRGVPLAIVRGREGRTGRTVELSADGLYRWQLRGGVADQVWRTMLGDIASWLLASPGEDSVLARPVDQVTQRGRAVRFRWSGSGTATPVPIALDGSGAHRVDTLRFDGGGNASLALGVGRYRYSLTGGGTGEIAVESYADELVSAPVTLHEHAGSAEARAPGRSLRELLWLFGVAVGAFGIEWLLRRRLGLR